ncbi:SLC25A44 [Cordylochernes scorpioides]|uniref:SLC25A44 n=1 Tax=Cordylochernes scorpioides TaxID=51811 RepID=A0ABY6LJ95_9ARAC|nr:SLC25A44 [Cordylochernes scorpioides]
MDWLSKSSRHSTGRMGFAGSTVATSLPYAAMYPPVPFGGCSIRCIRIRDTLGRDVNLKDSRLATPRNNEHLKKTGYVVASVVPEWTSQLAIHAMAGPMSGVTVACFTNPLDVIRAKIQVPHSLSLHDLARGIGGRLVKPFGFRPLRPGFDSRIGHFFLFKKKMLQWPPDSCKSPTPPASASNQTGLWHIYKSTEWTERCVSLHWLWSRCDDFRSPRMDLPAGHPFSTFVQRLDSFSQAARILWEEERFRALTKGLSARLLQSSISSFCIVLGYESLKRFSLQECYKDQVRW